MSSPVPSPFFLFGEIIIFGRDAAGVRDGHDHGGRNQGLGSLMGTRWTMDALNSVGVNQRGFEYYC